MFARRQRFGRAICGTLVSASAVGVSVGAAVGTSWAPAVGAGGAGVGRRASARKALGRPGRRSGRALPSAARVSLISALVRWALPTGCARSTRMWLFMARRSAALGLLRMNIRIAKLSCFCSSRVNLVTAARGFFAAALLRRRRRRRGPQGHAGRGRGRRRCDRRYRPRPLRRGRTGLRAFEDGSRRHRHRHDRRDLRRVARVHGELGYGDRAAADHQRAARADRDLLHAGDARRRRPAARPGPTGSSSRAVAAARAPCAGRAGSRGSPCSSTGAAGRARSRARRPWRPRRARRRRRRRRSRAPRRCAGGSRAPGRAASGSSRRSSTAGRRPPRARARRSRS